MSDEFANGMDTLTLSECNEYLRFGGVGVLAFCEASVPILRPVNFAMDEDAIVIRTGEGRIFEAAKRSESASFVISEIDRVEHAGRSVIVSGKLVERPVFGSLADIPLRPWAGSEKNHLIGLSIDRISGRRIADLLRGD